MLAFDPSQKMAGPVMAPAPLSASVAQAAKASGDDGEGFFDHLLDVVNPLQHLPVIGTLYRAITGDKLGAGEKIAGDALYGGLWGAVGSLADVVFEAATGKDFGSTMLALVTGDGDAPVKVADAAPRKDFGDRLWALFTGDGDAAASPRAYAGVAAPAIVAAQSLPSVAAPMLPASESPVTVASAAPDNFDVTAFSMALSSKGVDGETASRALYAYRRAMGASPRTPVFASLH